MAPTHPGKANWQRGAILIALLLIAAAIADWHREPYPLSDSHWDASIYLLRARNYASGDTLGAFREGAREIHDAVSRGVYPTPYWSFMRVGHTILLGTLVGFTGTTEASIHVLTWAYRVLLAIGLFFAAITPLRLVRVLNVGGPDSRLVAGALLSLVVYLLCDVAFYMSGHLISEVPAIALIAISAWALVRSLETGSKLYAVLSGVAAFMLYVVRMESVWAYVALLGAAAWSIWRSSLPLGGGWRTLAVSALTAALLFGAYSWVFFPLTDPRLAVRFSEATAKFAIAGQTHLAEGGSTRLIKQLVSANGLLWVGAALGLPLLRTSRAYQFGAAWFLLSLIPAGIALLHGTVTQTRMHTTLTPMLLLLSALGWAGFLSGVERTRAILGAAVLAGVSAFLLLVSQPASYSVLRDLPGMWRLQYVREFLAPMSFERIDYYLPELVGIERSIAPAGRGQIVVASRGMQVADHIMVIQYLSGSTDAIEKSSGAARRETGRVVPHSLRVRLSTTPVEDVKFLESLPDRPGVLLLAMAKEQDWVAEFACCGRLREIAATRHFALWELVRAP